jgi:hypothetical protein
MGFGVGVGDKMAAAVTLMITPPAGWGRRCRGEEEATPAAELVEEEGVNSPPPPAISLN